MNKSFIFLLLIVIIGCKKVVDKSANPQDVNQNINTAPKVFAGNDITITLPEDSVKLEATVIDNENNISEYIWKKISGPLSYRLMNGNALHSKVFDLHEGVYEFELTVTDKGGSIGKDTISVSVEPPINTAPTVSAGSDQIISLPVDHIILAGSATDLQNNIQSYQWRKISGPVAYQFENAYSAFTRVRGLETGIYEFEFTTTDKDGLMGKDTIIIYVIDHTKPGTNELVFKNLPRDCVWGPDDCYLIMVSFRSFIPFGTSFKVYAKMRESSNWIEAISDTQWTTEKFVYEIYNNILYIYTIDYTDLSKLEVKLIF